LFANCFLLFELSNEWPLEIKSLLLLVLLLLPVEWEMYTQLYNPMSTNLIREL